MARLRGLAIVIAACSALSPSVSFAAGTGGCESFAWPLKTELEWMAAGDVEAVASGATLTAPPAKAIAITLQPMESVTFAVPSSGKPKGDPATSFAGTLNFDSVAAAGLYQVSMSRVGWIDVVQNGKTLATEAHSGKSDCIGLRKSVRFNLDAGALSIQLSGVPDSTVKIAIRRAE